jgi:putative YphP/YqiW family bacilliredoxin
MYPTEIVAPMKAELTEVGFEELLTSEAAENAFKLPGTTLIFINSVCGCAAGAARPALVWAAKNAPKKPDHMLTTFAGYDTDAVKTTRQHLLPYPPSSPSIAILKDGKLVHMIERHMIEGRPAQMIAQHLIQVFDHFCEVEA